MGHSFAACSKEEGEAVYHVMRVLLTTMLVAGCSALGVDASHATEAFSESVRAVLYQRLHPAGTNPATTFFTPVRHSPDWL